MADIVRIGALLPASPRRRRKLGWLLACVAVVALVATVVVLVPRPKPLPETFSGQAQVATSGHARLSAAERNRIDTTLDRFLLAALDRSDPGGAWNLAGPDLRGTSTRADWIAGRMPILPFPAAGRQFHGWTHVAVGSGSVSFDLLVQPRAGTGLGASVFSVQVVERGGRWLVNRWYTLATFSPVGTKHAHVVGPNDFGAAAQGSASASDGRSSRGVWLAVPAGLFALGLLAIGLILGRNWLRYRRMRAVVDAERADD